MVRFIGEDIQGMFLNALLIFLLTRACLPRQRARVAEPLSRKYSGNAICPAVRGSDPGSHIHYAQETWRNPGG
eukprot:917476-Pelagomonas_calceolata.AAC.1